MGIVRNGMMAGLGAGLAQLGPMLAREQDREEDRAVRAQVAAAAAAERRQLAADSNATRLLLAQMAQAGRQGAGGGGGSGGGRGGAASFEPGSAAEVAEALALAEGVGRGDVPTGRLVRDAIMSGNRAPFEQDNMAVPSGLDAAGGGDRFVPAAADDMLRRKATVLQRIREEFAHGNDYKAVVDGRVKAPQAGVVRSIVDDTKLTAGEKMALTEGKPLFDDGPSGITNRITGAATPTARSNAAAARDNADAARPRNQGGRDSADPSKPPTGIDLERAARAAATELAVSLGVPLADLNATIARRQRTGALTVEQQEMLATYLRAQQRVRDLNNRAPAPAPSSAPTPTPTQAPRRIGNSTVTPL